MVKTDRETDRNLGNGQLFGATEQNGKVCKTFIRRFDSDPRLQQLSENAGVFVSPELPADSPQIAKNHRSAHGGPGQGRTAAQNGPTRWRRISSSKDAGPTAGVYALIWQGRALYIGQAGRLSERLRGHKWAFLPGGIRAKGGYYPGAYVKVRDCRKFGEWLMIEARLIRRLRPELNVRQMTRVLLSADIPDVIDVTDLLDFSKLPKPEPIIVRPPGWGYRPCDCGRVHEMSYESPRVDCPCGWFLELVTPAGSLPYGGSR